MGRLSEEFKFDNPLPMRNLLSGITPVLWIDVSGEDKHILHYLNKALLHNLEVKYGKD